MNWIFVIAESGIRGGRSAALRVKILQDRHVGVTGVQDLKMKLNFEESFSL
jgi:hypothetical protein